MAVNGLKTSGDGNVVIKDILSQLLQCNHVIGNQCFQDIVIVFPVSFAPPLHKNLMPLLYIRLMANARTLNCLQSDSDKGQFWYDL